MEYFDIVDEYGEPTGETVSREAAHKEGIRHRTAHVWIVKKTDKGYSVLLQKRSMEKDSFPGIFVDGFVTNQQDLMDEMYARADLHNENGAWQMIFGVNTVPSYRRKGHAAQLITTFIQDAKRQGRLGVVLTCKDDKVRYYSRFGFVNEGRSDKSSHGNAVWNQMRLTF